MTEPELSDNTRKSGAAPDTADETGVRGGDPDRLDSPGPGSGGVPAAGADGETGAREDLRTSLGERTPAAGREDGNDLEQSAAIGETDDPRSGSITGG